MTDEERPATYREVFASAEYPPLFAATILSLIGDMLAKVAVAVLVFDRTNSALLSAGAFAVGYLPWVAGGPILGALADRLPWRRTLVLCDVARAVLVGVLALPGIPLPVLLLVLFGASLLTPPFEAARSALLPELLPGDRYVVGLSLEKIAAQLSQALGFVFGGAIATLITAQGALVLDAGTFVLSGLLIRFGVRARPAPVPSARRSSLTADTIAGLRLVFGDRRLRAYMLLAWLTSAAVFAPEGLAAPLAAAYGGGAFLVGLLLGANPIGTIIGGLVVGRLLTPAQRTRSPRILALLAVVVLIPIALPLPVWAVLLLYVVSGVGMAFLIPVNAMYVRAVPVPYRARAFGVAQSGLQVSQGIAVVVAGAVADHTEARYVIAAAGAVGLLTVLPVLARWPAPEVTPAPVREPVTGAAGRMEG